MNYQTQMLAHRHENDKHQPVSKTLMPKLTNKTFFQRLLASQPLNVLVRRVRKPQAKQPAA